MGALTLLLALTGCDGLVWGVESKKKHDLGVRPIEIAQSAATRDTVGEFAVIGGLADMQVQSYGLVVGLGENGATDCPREVFDKLVETIVKKYPLQSNIVGVESMTPEQLIRDPDTAPVIVEAFIPGGATKGTRLDAFVSLVPGTNAKSLRGGRLYTCELEYLIPTRMPEVSKASGRVLAVAQGPLFLNPFSSEEDAATQSVENQATVPGGVYVTQDRRLRLELNEPSHSFAANLARIILWRFPLEPKAADAVSPAFINIAIPKDFADERTHFLSLLPHVYVRHDAAFVQDRCKKLAEELVRLNAPHAHVALGFEALGEEALPTLQTLYANKQDHASFFAAAAGINLNDPLAADVLARHAADSQCPFRFKAIEALGRAHNMRSALRPMRDLLNDEDPRVRIAAYRELAERGDVSMTTLPVGSDNFILDIVPSTRDPLIYVRRSGTRRIALMGDALACSPPLFYLSPDQLLLIQSAEGNDGIEVKRWTPKTRQPSPTLQLDGNVVELTKILGEDPGMEEGRVEGLGFDYTAVIHVLYKLCEQKSIRAAFMMEEVNYAEMFGPAARRGRPESEL